MPGKDIVSLLNVKSSFSESALRGLFQDSQTIYLPSERIIYSQEETPNRIFLLRKGSVRIIRYYENGVRRLFGYHQPGTVFGEGMAIMGMPSEITIETVMPCKLSVVDSEVFLSRIDTLGLRKELLFSNQQKYADVWQRTVILQESSRQDLVTTLLEHGMTQRDVADFIGISTMQVFRLKNKKKTPPDQT